MTSNVQHLEGVASSTLAPAARCYLAVPVFTDGEHEGEPDEVGLLAALQAAHLVSRDVRAVYLETRAEAGALVLTVLDVDTEGTIAWVTLPMGAGA